MQYRAGDIRHCFASVEKAKRAARVRAVYELRGRDARPDLVAGWRKRPPAIRVNEATEALERRGLTDYRQSLEDRAPPRSKHVLASAFAVDAESPLRNSLHSPMSAASRRIADARAAGIAR